LKIELKKAMFTLFSSIFISVGYRTLMGRLFLLGSCLLTSGVDSLNGNFLFDSWSDLSSSCCLTGAMLMAGIEMWGKILVMKEGLGLVLVVMPRYIPFLGKLWCHPVQTCHSPQGSSVH
jgi:hypothetical protein